MTPQLLAVISGISLAGASYCWESRYRPVNTRAAVMLIVAVAWLSFVALRPLNTGSKPTKVRTASGEVIELHYLDAPNVLRMDANHGVFLTEHK